MKIIEATWEKRNLGCTAFEVSLNKGDLLNIDNILVELNSNKFAGGFVTLKMPVGNIMAIHQLEKSGFRFVETQFQIGYDLAQYSCPPSVADFISPVTQVEVPKNAEAWRGVSEIITPDLFETDRISLDPCFGKVVGCTRYRNWMLDLVTDADARLYVFHAPNDPETLHGFTLVKERQRISRAILGGVFSHCKIPGVGVSIWNQFLKNASERGFARIETAVSSNNPAVLVMDSVLGYVIEKMTYVMRKI